MKRTLLYSLIVSMSMFTLPSYASSSADKDIKEELLSLKKEVAQLKTQINETSIHHVKKIKQQKITKDHRGVKVSTVKNIGMLAHETPYFPIDFDVPGQAFVSSGPYLGIPLQYSGGNLIINNPTIDQDVSLLTMRKNIYHRLSELGIEKGTEHAHVLLSGIIEAQGMYKNIGNSAAPSSSDIDLTGAGLDAYIIGPTNWVSALLSLSYDNDLGTNTGSLNNNSRVQNSRFFVNQAFITIGDFRFSPFYATIGQFYVPFGAYSSNMVSSPLTKLMAKTKARALTLGYRPQSDNSLFAAAYVFKGDSHVTATNKISNGGINMGYHFLNDHFSGMIGGGVIANIADSLGMQNTGNAPLFGGFGSSTAGNELIVHRVPAYNLRGLISLGKHVDLLGEYITASTRFSPNDLTMNAHGAKPRALNVEGAYTFTDWARPTSFALGYGMTKDALALGLPAQRYSFVVNTSIWKETLQSIEFRRDLNYRTSSSATGSLISPAINGTGKPNNMVTAQFDFYF